MSYKIIKTAALNMKKAISNIKMLRFRVPHRHSSPVLFPCNIVSKGILTDGFQNLIKISFNILQNLIT